MVVGGVRVGYEHRRLAEGRDLGERRGAGATEDQIRHPIGGRHVVDEWPDVSFEPLLAVAAAHPFEIRLARLMHDVRRRARSGDEGHRFDPDLVQSVGPGAAAENQHRESGPALRRLADRWPDRVAGENRALGRKIARALWEGYADAIGKAR